MDRRRPSKGKRLELYEIHGGPPADHPKPIPRELVCYSVDFVVGRADVAYVLWFRATVATPEGLAAMAENEQATQCVLADRATIVVSDFDWDTVRAHIEGVLVQCEAPALSDSLPLLERFFVYEDENYVP